ncbi:hypothetical protein SKAU_G00414050 [Synaphobranchus kaupii]|uniref:Uncharacterized protein n=1 Tax=Synaphobranchus kaupii TaxID=118154 RepID=A0A9Q1E745_SYNKA|nr:hypothetical protein SKAU_G00414050 [Synaphobranchus kaupii]
MFNCCSHGTLLHFGLQSSRLNICYYHQDLHPRRLHPGPRPRLPCSPRRPSYSSRRSPRGSRCRRRPGMGPTLQRHPFSGLVDSAGRTTDLHVRTAADLHQSTVRPGRQSRRRRGAPSRAAAPAATPPYPREGEDGAGRGSPGRRGSGRLPRPRGKRRGRGRGAVTLDDGATSHLPLGPFLADPEPVAALFKVLFNFPLRYLSTIGLVPVFSLRWSLPPALGCIPKQPDSEKTSPLRDGGRYRPHTIHGLSLDQKDSGP